MIATVTLNPAVDYTVKLSQPLRKAEVNRTAAERISIGGKGINVSYILQQMRVSSTIYGFVAGATGTMISDAAAALSLRANWISLDGQCSRINLKIEETGVVTELNGKGITLDKQALETLIAMLQKFGADDTVVLAGSIPSGANSSLYADIIRALPQNVRFAVDTEGDALRAVLPLHPFVIKPNLPELSGLFGVNLHTVQDALPYGKKLQEMGAQNVIVSLGGDGALLFADDGSILRMDAPHGTVINTVGAGDSMLGGFLAACESGLSRADALRYGIAAGSATAFSPWLAGQADIDALLRTLPVPTRL